MKEFRIAIVFHLPHIVSINTKKSFIEEPYAIKLMKYIQRVSKKRLFLCLNKCKVHTVTKLVIMKRLFLLLVVVLLSSPIWAQENQTSTGCSDVFQCLTATTTGTGKLKVIQDEKLKAQVLRHVEWHRTQKGMQGYRIRIYSNSGQTANKQASGERARFMKLYPDVESYLQFDTPNYKVYVGDFRTKSDAYAFLVKIKAEFPKAFLVEQKINFPKL